MITRTRLDQKGSLNAIWYEYLSVKVLLSNTKNSAKSDTNVGHAFLNARYYDSQRGQFLSEDPTFLTIGDCASTQRLTRRSQDSFLTDPQQLNSYNYGRNNPITIKDPDGLFIPEAVVGAGIGGVVGVGIQA
jgi:RHS repeat-associated protein